MGPHQLPVQRRTPHAAPLQSLAGTPVVIPHGPLQGLPGVLQEEPALRVEDLGLARREVEESELDKTPPKVHYLGAI